MILKALSVPRGAAFNNEFGRPNILGYLPEPMKSKWLALNGEEVRGYHKPIMIGRCVSGNIRENHVEKGEILVGAPLVLARWPSHEYWLGWRCCASSMASGDSSEDLDFPLRVQRGKNPAKEGAG